ncbi:MAG: hypothetical protein Q4E18_05290 [Clostridia bacterium]|nr:hypothetical protein [Clostridia bacterium]
MEALEEIAGYLPRRIGDALLEAGRQNRVENVRLRAGGAEVLAERITPTESRGIVSTNAYEDELEQRG